MEEIIVDWENIPCPNKEMILCIPLGIHTTGNTRCLNEMYGFSKTTIVGISDITF